MSDAASLHADLQLIPIARAKEEEDVAHLYSEIFFCSPTQTNGTADIA